MDILEEYEELKGKAAKLQSEKDKAAGVLEKTKQLLLDEFGCKTIKQAKKYLAKLREDLQESEDECKRTFTEFRKAYEKWEEHN